MNLLCPKTIDNKSELFTAILWSKKIFLTKEFDRSNFKYL